MFAFSDFSGAQSCDGNVVVLLQIISESRLKINSRCLTASDPVVTKLEKRNFKHTDFQNFVSWIP